MESYVKDLFSRKSEEDNSNLVDFPKFFDEIVETMEAEGVRNFFLGIGEVDQFRWMIDLRYFG